MILPALAIEANPDPSDLEFMDDRINEYNIAQTGYHDFQWLAAFIRDDAQNIVAGVTGFTWGRSCRIQSLWVHPGLRGLGHGSALMQAAEREAVTHGSRA
jgi:ribosomal protein S18 acetylase RimI-like enzyme